MSNNHDDTKDDDQDIRRLLQAAGPRQQPSSEMRDRVHAVALQEWEATTARVSRKKQHFVSSRNLLALAATFAVVSLVGLLGWQAMDNSENVPLADVKYASGSYSVLNDHGADADLPFVAGVAVRTGTGSRLMLALAAGGTIYLDQDSQIVLQDDQTVEVERGRIYVDSSLQDRLRIVTPTATISDIGTLFEVTLLKSGLVVALREGKLNVTTGEQMLSASAREDEGELIQIVDGNVSRNPLSTLDQRWEWAQQARPPLQLRDVSVYEYLKWVARDSGRTLRFETRSAELLAQSEHFQNAITTDQVDVDAALDTTSRFRRVSSEPHILLVGLLH